MPNKAHKRINDRENQQANPTRRQRLAYSVNVAEHLHPSFLNQTKGPRTRAKIPPLHKHEVQEYFPHLATPHNGETQRPTPCNELGSTHGMASGDNPPPPEMTQTELELQEEILKFYENLYKNEEPDHQAMATVIQLLTQKQVASWKVCEGKITEQELEFVVNKTKNNKSPGTDGIPYEYYKKHLHDISPFLVQYYNDIIEQGVLGPSMLEGIITLMYEEKGANTHIKNYRPITLLNCDLKIFTAILALRLAKVMHEVSTPTNTAAVPGRNITDNTMTLHMVQCYLDGEEIDGYAIMIDGYAIGTSYMLPYRSWALDHGSGNG